MEETHTQPTMNTGVLSEHTPCDCLYEAQNLCKTKAVLLREPYASAKSMKKIQEITAVTFRSVIGWLGEKRE